MDLYTAVVRFCGDTDCRSDWHTENSDRCKAIA